MSEQTQWPRPRWFTWLGLALSVGGLIWFVQIQKCRMPLVEREDLNAFIRVALPAVPGWKTYTILETANGENAIPSDAGSLHPTRLKPDRQKLKAFLQSEVYGEPLWRVLQWPLLAFLVIFVGLVRLGRMLDAERSSDRWIRGTKLVSQWRWNLHTALRRKTFYVEVE